MSSRRRQNRRDRDHETSLDDWPVTSRYVFAQQPWHYHFGRTWPSRDRTSARIRQLNAWCVVFTIAVLELCTVLYLLTLPR